MHFINKYTDSRAFASRCKEASYAMAHSKDVEVIDINTYPQLIINGKGFHPEVFGKHRAQLLINNIETITDFAMNNDASAELVLHGKSQHVEVSLNTCLTVIKYESYIRQFINNPLFLAQ